MPAACRSGGLRPAGIPCCRLAIRIRMSSDNARIGFVGWIVFVLVAIPALAQSGAIEGIVVDAVTKAPIAGADVKLYSGDTAVQFGGSDAQGLFCIAGVPDRQYRR